MSKAFNSAVEIIGQLQAENERLRKALEYAHGVFAANKSFKYAAKTIDKALKGE